MFVDEAEIWVKAGNGGNGCLSFRREKFVPKGGPDGGNGGRGGSVYFEAREDKDTLLDFTGRHHWRAGNGNGGEGANKSGLDGDDLVIPVPAGTMVYDKELGLLLKDINKVGMRVCICKGGKGGKGNKTFATSVNQAPRHITLGEEGEERHLRLELKLIADVGLVGMPNAGKSTLISRCSAARPKIANYPFTTLEPVLGIVELSDYRRFTMADIPGLIEGAHAGAGLGHDFLRHIERTRIIVHMLDIQPTDGSEPAANYAKIRKELELYSKTLAGKDEIVAVNKIDIGECEEIVEEISEKLGLPVYAISAVTGAGVKELTEVLWKKIEESKANEEETL